MAFISIAEVDEEASLEECWGALPEWKVNQYKKASSARFRSASSTGYLLALVLAERASSRKLDIVRGPQGKPAFAARGLSESISRMRRVTFRASPPTCFRRASVRCAVASPLRI